MKHNKILIIKVSFMFLFIFNFIAIYGHNRDDNMQKPSYIVNGEMYTLKSTENKNAIESGLSSYRAKITSNDLWWCFISSFYQNKN